MNTKLKNKIIIVSFISMILGFTLINIISKDEEISYEERRKLKQLPKFSVESLLDGKYFNELEEYVLDQFVFRTQFRNLKSTINIKVLNENDSNKLYTMDDYIIKREYPLNEQSVYNSAQIYNKLKEVYFKNCNVYYTIVPDKNYFVPKSNNYLSMDYENMIDIMKNNTKNMKYINIIDDLKISDYYKTDIHWKQENIVNIADKLLTSMNNKDLDYDYNIKEVYPFKGAYYGQYGMKSKPDKLKYLSNDIIEEAKVFDYEEQNYKKIYNEKDLKNVDTYDIFLSGAKPLLEIENPNSPNKKELYIVRDSFGSSLAPLLVGEYSKVILIDLRYITFDELGKYIQPKENSDVLFMYNTLILNDSSVISR